MRKRVFWLTAFLTATLLCAAADADGLRITEVITSNSAYEEKNGETCDLVELCNTGEEPVTLDGYYLSDKEKKPFRYQLPDATLQPGGYFIIRCDGDEDGGVPFKLSSDGETLVLTAAGGTEPTDRLVIPPLPHNVSYGRGGDGSLCYYEQPTFGKTNGEGKARIAEPPTCDIESGLYSEAFTVTLTGDDEMLYTLDGSDPTKNGMPYQQPIPVGESLCLRFCSAAPDAVTSTVITKHYLFGCEQYELPIISISSQPGTVTGKNGLWERYQNRGLEARINLCLIENGDEKFAVDCGLTLHGQGSRALTKKSFNIKFRGRYGMSELAYPLFGEGCPDVYNSLVLRGGSEDYNRAMMRDELLTSITRDSMPSVLAQAYRPVNLFVDGAYYGLYYLRERIDQQFAASYLGGDAEEVDIVNGWRIAQDGDPDAAKQFIRLWRSCKNADCTDADTLEKILSQVDLESFIDYAIIRAYSGDRDYPNIRHVRAYGDGKWHLVNFDLDWAFGSEPANLYGLLGKPHETTQLNNLILYALLKNEDVRETFLNRLSLHLHTTFQPERVIQRIDEIEAEIRHDIAYDRERWHLSLSKWEESVQYLRTFAKERIPQVVESAKRTFALTEEEFNRYFGDL